MRPKYFPCPYSLKNTRKIANPKEKNQGRPQSGMMAAASVVAAMVKPSMKSWKQHTD